MLVQLRRESYASPTGADVSTGMARLGRRANRTPFRSPARGDGEASGYDQATLRCCNNSQFDLLASSPPDQVAQHHPGMLVENAPIESFNGRLRDECLNETWFLSLEDAAEKIGAWRRHYNADRPHRSLENLAPLEFAAQFTSSHPRSAAEPKLDSAELVLPSEGILFSERAVRQVGERVSETAGMPEK